MLTLTCPGGTQAVYQAFQDAGGYLVNRFNTFLRRLVKDKEYVYVWELQARGAPHLHYVFRLAKGLDPDAILALCRAKWREALEALSDDSGVDMFQTESGDSWRGDHTKPVTFLGLIRKDPGRYLSKYMSKTRTKGGGVNSWHPGRWGAVSYSLLARLHRETRTFEARASYAVPLQNFETALVMLMDELETRLYLSRNALDWNTLFLKFDLPPPEAQEIFEFFIAAMEERISPLDACRCLVQICRDHKGEIL